MKNIYVLLILFSLSTAAFAQDGPVLKITGTNEHNFGKITEEAGPASHTYKFTNLGNKPLKIDKVVPGCGCTTPDWSKEEIKPGKEGFIKATFDPTGRPGPFNKYVTVYSNANPNVMVLSFKGEVIARPQTVEDSFPVISGNLRYIMNHINFGPVKNNIKDTVQDLVVYNISNKPITIKAVKGIDYVTTSLPLTIPVRKETRIPFHYNATLVQDYGLAFDQMRLQTDDEKEPEKTVSVIADIHQYVPLLSDVERSKSARLEFETKLHEFGDIKQGEIRKTNFKFSNRGKKDLTLYKVKSTCGCTVTDPKKMELKPGESSEIEVTFYSAGKHGKESKDITVYSNDPMNPEMQIRITANILVPKP
jgi:hypothetical protein